MSAYYYDLQWEYRDDVVQHLDDLGWSVDISFSPFGPVLKLSITHEYEVLFESTSPLFCFDWKTVAFLVETAGGVDFPLEV
jgi:hypothetical protein